MTEYALKCYCDIDVGPGPTFQTHSGYSVVLCDKSYCCYWFSGLELVFYSKAYVCFSVLPQYPCVRLQIEWDSYISTSLYRSAIQLTDEQSV